MKLILLSLFLYANFCFSSDDHRVYYMIYMNKLRNIASRAYFDEEKFSEATKDLLDYFSENKHNIESSTNIDVERTVSQIKRVANSIKNLRDCLGHNLGNSITSSLSLDTLTLSMNNRNPVICNVDRNDDRGIFSNVEIIDGTRKELLKKEFIQEQKELMANKIFKEMMILKDYFKGVDNEMFWGEICKNSLCPQEFSDKLKDLEEFDSKNKIKFTSYKEIVDDLNKKIEHYNSNLRKESRFQIATGYSQKNESVSLSTLNTHLYQDESDSAMEQRYYDILLNTEAIKSAVGDVEKPFDLSSVNRKLAKGRTQIINQSLFLTKLENKTCKKTKKRGVCQAVSSEDIVRKAYLEKKEALISSFRGIMEIDNLEDLLQEGELQVLFNLSSLDYNPLFIICDELKSHLNKKYWVQKTAKGAEYVSNGLDVLTAGSIISGALTAPGLVVAGAKKATFKGLISGIKSFASPKYNKKGLELFTPKTREGKFLLTSITVAGTSDSVSSMVETYSNWQSSNEVFRVLGSSASSQDNELSLKKSELIEQTAEGIAFAAIDIVPVVKKSAKGPKKKLSLVPHLPKKNKLLAFMDFYGMERAKSMLRMAMGRYVDKIGVEKSRKIYQEWSHGVEKCLDR